MAEFFKIINWNINGPDMERAQEQLSFLLKEEFTIMILTEVKASPACLYIRDKLIDAGYLVTFPDITENEEGMMVATKFSSECSINPNAPPYRIKSIRCIDFMVTGVFLSSRASRTAGKISYDIDKDAQRVVALDAPYPQDGTVHKELYDWFVDAGFVDAYEAKSGFKKEYLPNNFFVTKNIVSRIIDCYYLDTHLSRFQPLVLEIK